MTANGAQAPAKPANHAVPMICGSLPIGLSLDSRNEGMKK